MAKKLWESLEWKYKIEDEKTKKFIVLVQRAPYIEPMF